MQNKFLDYEGLKLYNCLIQTLISSRYDELLEGLTDISGRLSTSEDNINRLGYLYNNLKVLVNSLQKAIISGITVDSGISLDNVASYKEDWGDDLSHGVSSMGVFYTTSNRTAYYETSYEQRLQSGSYTDIFTVQFPDGENEAAALLIGKNGGLQRGGSFVVEMAHEVSSPIVFIDFGEPYIIKYPVVWNGKPASVTNSWERGEIVRMTFDGTSFIASSFVSRKSAEDTPYELGGTETIKEVVDNIDERTGVNEVDIADLKAAVEALSKGVKLTITVYPEYIYQGELTDVTITSRLSEVPSSGVSSLVLSDTRGVLVSGTSVTTISAQRRYDSTMRFTTTAVYMGTTFTEANSVRAYYPIYYGFGVTYDTADLKKLSARPSAAGTYTDTSTQDNVHFYIMVPVGVSELDPNGFTMGGAPYVMNMAQVICQGVSYKVYQSGAIYASGVTVNVTAKNR